MEVMIPTEHKVPVRNYLGTNEEQITTIKKEFLPANIGLCALTSINLLEFGKLNDEEQIKFINILVEGADNIVDTQYYPVKDAKYTNLKYRPQGIGVTNYVAWLASLKHKITDIEAIESTRKMFSKLRRLIYTASCKLAKERGSTFGFNYDNFINNLYTTDGLSDELLSNIERYGLRFQYHLSLPPGATSSKCLGLTEGCEPIVQQFYIEDNKGALLPSLAPHIKEYRNYYVNAFDIKNNKHLIDLASVRQEYLDQAQSITLYYEQDECQNASDLAEDILYAWKKKLKSLYYMKTPKAKELICESCS
jgi:ribonucleoside-diphosphate reductase alpha chain